MLCFRCAIAGAVTREDIAMGGNFIASLRFDKSLCILCVGEHWELSYGCSQCRFLIKMQEEEGAFCASW